MPRFMLFAKVVLVAAASGCSDEGGAPTGGSGGAAPGGTGSGGVTGSSGAAATGGSLAPSQGGAPSSGGSPGARGGSPGGAGGITGGAGGITGGASGALSSSGGTAASLGGSPLAGGTAGTAGAPGSGGSAGSATGGSGGATNSMSFFVTSQTSKTGNLGGLKAADDRCQALAAAVGAGSRLWRAYLSADADPDNNGLPVNARDRIGKGPWYNQKGALLATDLEALHARKGDAELFVDEKGNRINGQWTGSLTPNEHDILTGSSADGTLLKGQTCSSWTSQESGLKAQIGHSDGLGPKGATTGTYTSWNAAHTNAGCNDTAPQGGAGRYYCFATN